MAPMMRKTRPMGRPTFSPSFLLLEGAEEEGVESVERRVKVGPAKISGLLPPPWSTTRARVRLAVDWPSSQMEDMLRKTEPS